MKNKNEKMPFAVFVLKYAENMVKDYAEESRSEYDFLFDLVRECEQCPLKTVGVCEGYCGLHNCEKLLKEYVESAE